jgi:hypothetical protein
MAAMTRRRILCGLLLLSALLACFASWLWVVNGRKVTRARIEQVQKGMTREEVIRTVGRQPDGRFDHSDWWACDDAELELLIAFDDADRAAEVVVFNAGLRPSGLVLRPPTLTERIRRWLGL